MAHPSSKYTHPEDTGLPPFRTDLPNSTQFKNPFHSPTHFSFNSTGGLLGNPISSPNDTLQNTLAGLSRQKKGIFQLPEYNHHSSLKNDPIPSYQVPIQTNTHEIEQRMEQYIKNFSTPDEKENDPYSHNGFKISPNVQRLLTNEFDSPFSTKVPKTDLSTISPNNYTTSTEADQNQPAPNVSPYSNTTQELLAQASAQFAQLQNTSLLSDRLSETRKAAPSKRYQETTVSTEFPTTDAPTHTPNNSEQVQQETEVDNNNTTQDPLNMSGLSRTTSKRRLKPIVVMNIDIGAQNKAELQVFEQDEPEEVAKAFCEKHGLPSKVIKILVKNINLQVNNFYTMKAENARKKSIISNGGSTKEEEVQPQPQIQQIQQPQTQFQPTYTQSQPQTPIQYSQTQVHSQTQPQPQPQTPIQHTQKSKYENVSSPIPQDKQRSLPQVSDSCTIIESDLQGPGSIAQTPKQSTVRQSTKQPNTNSLPVFGQIESQHQQQQPQFNNVYQQKQPQSPVHHTYTSYTQPSTPSGNFVFQPQTPVQQSQKQFQTPKQTAIDQDLPVYNNPTRQVNSVKPQVPRLFDNEYSSISDIQTPKQLSSRQTLTERERQSEAPDTNRSVRESTVSKQAVIEQYERWTSIMSDKKKGKFSKASQSPSTHRKTDRELIIESTDKKKITRSRSSKSVKNLNESSRFEENPSDVSYQFNNAKKAIFNRLYEEGMQSMKQKELFDQERKRIKQEEELRDATFRPKINHISSELAQHRIGKVENLLLNQASIQKEKREKSGFRRENLELSQCTFQPEIDKETRRIMTARNTREPVGIHNRLYEEAKLKTQKQKVMQEDSTRYGTFKPAISKGSAKLTERGRNPQNDEPHERLYQNFVQKKKSQSQKREEIEDSLLYDEQTGQKFFQPQINKNNKYYKAAATTQRDRYVVEEVVEVDPEIFQQRARTPGNKKPEKPEPTSVKKVLQKMGSTKIIQAQPQPNKKDIIQVQISRQNNQVLPVQRKESTQTQSQGSKKTSQENSFVSYKEPRLQKKSSKSDEVEAQLLWEIFRLLDSDSDGKISAEDVDVSGIKAEILECISEIIFALEDDLTLGFEDFCNLAIQNRAVDRLRPICGLPSKEEEEEEESQTSYSDSHRQYEQPIVSDRQHYIKNAPQSRVNVVKNVNNGPQQKQNQGLTRKYQELAKKAFNK